MNPKFNDPAPVRRQSSIVSFSPNQANVVKKKSSFRRVAWIRIAANRIILTNSNRVWLLKDNSKFRFVKSK